MGCGGSKDNSAKLARAEQQASEARIKQGKVNIDSVFSQFSPTFYGDQQAKYEQYALPQLQEQYNQTGDNLTYKLFGQGLQNSSVGRNVGNSLSQEYAKQTRAIGDEGLRRSQELQGNVAQQKMSLLNQLQASSDPQQAMQGAIAASQQFNAPSPMMPIGQAFNNWSNIYLQSKHAAAYNDASNYLKQQNFNVGGTLPKNVGYNN